MANKKKDETTAVETDEVTPVETNEPVVVENPTHVDNIADMVEEKKTLKHEHKEKKTTHTLGNVTITL